MKINLLKITTFSFLLVNSLSFGQTIVEKYGRLQVNESHVTSETGEKISLAGNSLFWSNAGDVADYYNATTVKHLASNWESQIVRAALGVKEPWDNGTGYIDNRAVQTKKIERVVEAAIEAGIYVIIDWHTHNAENYTTDAIAFFTEMAEKYGSYDNVIYEIYNEPINTPWSEIKNYAEQVIQGIRSKDTDNLIVVGTRTFSQEVEEVADNKINDPNVAYTLHFYAGTHFQWLRDRATRAMDKGVALFVTEYGTSLADGTGSLFDLETKDWINYLESNHISYVNWSISDKNEAATSVLPGQGVQGLINDQLNENGRYIKNLLLAKNETVLSINDLKIEGEKISIYPNPVIDVLTVNTKAKITKFSVYDMNGNLLLLDNITKNTTLEINLTQLSTGNYLLLLEGKTQKTVAKISKL